MVGSFCETRNDELRPTQTPYKLPEKDLADVCASVQEAIVDVLVRKTIAAARKHDVDLVTVSGGVSCNRVLRKQLDEACKRHGLEFKTAEPWLCTNNAGMHHLAAKLKIAHDRHTTVND